MRSEHIDNLRTALDALEKDDKELAVRSLEDIQDDVMKPIWTCSKGEEYFEEDLALSELIEADIVVCYPAKVTLQDGADYKFIGLNVRHSDLFMWACTDYEHIEYSDLRSVYEASQQPHGIEKWCCKRRNYQPQKPYRDLMKNSGVWDDEMEALDKNYDDKEVTDAQA